MQRDRIVVRRQTGKLQISPEAQEMIERRVAFFFGNGCRGVAFWSIEVRVRGEFRDTHFVINFDNGKTLSLRGDASVRYADVTSCG